MRSSSPVPAARGRQREWRRHRRHLLRLRGYLAPVGNGVQVDVGKIPTPLGAEVVQTNGNYFITQGAVFGLQPVRACRVHDAAHRFLGFTGGIVNDVYSDTGISGDNDKAYYGQFQFGDGFGLNVGGIGDADASACAPRPARVAGTTNVRCSST